MERVLCCVDRMVSESMCDLLLSPYSEEEIRRALFSMGPTKAPRPDGFHALFFQKNWTTVGYDISRLCIGVLEGKHPIRALNLTNVALIPKVKVPRKMVDFRPISLFNVVYEIITKVLASHLKVIL